MFTGQCTIKDGGLVRTSRSYAINGTEGSLIIVDSDGVVEGLQERGYGIYSKGGTIYIRGGKVSANGAAIVSAASDSYLSITKGTVTGSCPGVATVQVSNQGKISGGTITHSTGYYALMIQLRATCDITGGTISSVYDYNK